jgi:hypothetical protein
MIYPFLLTNASGIAANLTSTTDENQLNALLMFAEVPPFAYPIHRTIAPSVDKLPLLNPVFGFKWIFIFIQIPMGPLLYQFSFRRVLPRRYTESLTFKL